MELGLHDLLGQVALAELHGLGYCLHLRLFGGQLVQAGVQSDLKSLRVIDQLDLLALCSGLLLLQLECHE